jgi:NADP-dependent 3-hydroxy acid dehydrogenase YdfG
MRYLQDDFGVRFMPFRSFLRNNAMTNYVSEKVIIVTGAASGFGRLISQKAATMGALLVCTDINAAELEVTTSSIEENGGVCIGIVADVSNSENMTDLARTAVERFGRIDVLINNAGVMPLAFFSDHQKAMRAWERCIDINIKGVLNGITAVYDQMIEQGRGHIVNLSSIYGNHGLAGSSVYGATKAAVNYLSDSLRVESQGKIKVSVVKPTGVPGTGLGSSVINLAAVVPLSGHQGPADLEELIQSFTVEKPPECIDPNNIAYKNAAPEDIADQIIYVINQPWGVNIGEITVRASGENVIV